MKADHVRSEGARYERAAVRSYLRRLIHKAGAYDASTFKIILDWVLTRQQRYDKAPGGLGRTITEKQDTTSRKR